MRPAALSAANTSPLGATRMRRGAARPEVNRLTSKPFGTIGFCSLVRRTVLTTLLAEWARLGAGRFCGLMSRRVPGRSARQSPNAAVPRSRVGPVWAKSGMTAIKTIPATQVARTAQIGKRIGCSRRGPIIEQTEIGAVPSPLPTLPRLRGNSIYPPPRAGKSNSIYPPPRAGEGREGVSGLSRWAPLRVFNLNVRPARAT
jgi:hypothetical protein